MKAPSKKIRILHITSTPYGIGGVEKLLLSLSEQYDNQKYELFFCNLFSRDYDQEFITGLRKKGFSPYCLKGRSYLDALLFIPALSSYIKKNEIDIVHTWLFHSNLIGQIAAALAGKRIRVLSRQYKDYFYIYGNKFKQILDKISNFFAHIIIACSNGIRKHLTEVENVAACKIEVINNAVDLKSMYSNPVNKSKIISEFGLSGKKCVGVIANLHPRKGHKYLLEAIAKVKIEMPEIRVLLIGDGPYRTYLQKEVARLGIKENILFTGYRQDIADLISVLDLVVQPSIEEGFGISLLEAMSMNKPIIASNVGGIPEVIAMYNGGILVPPGDPCSLAENIKKILFCNNISGTISNKGRELVESKFSINEMARKYENVYSRLYFQIKHKQSEENA